MTRLVVRPHMRLQEWVAEEKGYFKDEGLDYDFRVFTAADVKLAVKSSQELPEDQIRGAYQTFEGSGRGEGSVSCACHWTVNMAAAAGHGKLWGEAYSVTPGGIYVPADSDVRKPEDLANVPVTVGYQSGSHYSTIQALEPFLQTEEVKLHFGGMLFQRMELLIDGEIPAATMFGGPMYFVEQLGFRKILDSSFMIATMVASGVDAEDVRKMYRALKRAQKDIDLRPELYTHYYKDEFPKRFHDVMDTRVFGPGERIVFMSYDQSIFEETQKWIVDANIFTEGLGDRVGYRDAVMAAK